MLITTKILYCCGCDHVKISLKKLFYSNFCFPFQDRVDQGIEMEGSNLSGVSGRCSWEEPNQQQLHNHYNMEDNRETHYDLNSRGKAQISDYGNII